MPSTAHSDYGGSVADKWTNCPGYIDAVRDLPPSPPTIYPVGGSAQHGLNEVTIRSGRPPEEWVGKPWSTIIDVPEGVSDELFDEGNVERCRVWLSFIHEFCDPLHYDLHMEEGVVLSSISPEMFGTADLIAINRDEKHIIIPDYKDGAGKIVNVVTSPQPRFYAVGAVDSFDFGFDPSWTVTYGIVQPKAPTPITYHTVKGSDVFEWRGIFRSAYERSKRDPVRVAGEHCHWCRAAGTCEARTNRNRLAMRADFGGAVSGITPETVAKLITVGPEIESWLEDVREHARTLAERGELPGFELVEGRAGARKWGDETAAADELTRLLGNDAYVRALLTPAAAEKKLGKDRFEILKQFVVQAAGKPALSPVGSQKELFDRQKVARADFVGTEVSP